MTRRPWPLLALALAVGASLLTTGAVPAREAQVARGATETAPCGWRTDPPSHYSHVMWLFLENRSYEQVIGPAGSVVRGRAPYLNQLAHQCGQASSYWGITHPSLPNYLAAVSGSTGGVSSSCRPGDCPQRRSTLLGRLRKAGRSWRVYAESMGTRCRRHDAYPYVVRHNPALYFPSLADDCARQDVPMGTTSRGRLQYDLAKGRLPALSLLIPNQCHNSHDCSVRASDDWLRRWVPAILRSPDYRAGQTVLFITYDEGTDGAAGRDCTRDPDSTCHIPIVVASAAVRPGTVAADRFDHYSLLKTTTQLLNVGPLLGHAADPGTSSMRSAFGL